MRARISMCACSPVYNVAWNIKKNARDEERREGSVARVAGVRACVFRLSTKRKLAHAGRAQTYPVGVHFTKNFLSLASLLPLSLLFTHAEDWACAHAHSAQHKCLKHVPLV